MKLSVDLKQLNPLKQLLNNISIVLWLFLGLVFLMVVWTVFAEVTKITQSQTDLTLAQSRIVRVNMDKYKAIEQQLNDNASFSAQDIPGTDAFLPLSSEQDED